MAGGIVTYGRLRWVMQNKVRLPKGNPGRLYIEIEADGSGTMMYGDQLLLAWQNENRLDEKLELIQRGQIKLVV